DLSVIENRINVYREKTEPIINYCKEKGIYQPVNGMGSIDDIFERLCEVMRKYF
ncbi:MAG TPA: adenylate kinase, partial [Bacteroidales bacterium]|nr:adenylate kinase [Bacteroidales bacterium]